MTELNTFCRERSRKGVIKVYTVRYVLMKMIQLKLYVQRLAEEFVMII